MADLRKAIRFDKCDCQLSVLGVKSPGIRVEHLEKKPVKPEASTSSEEGVEEGREGFRVAVFIMNYGVFDLESLHPPQVHHCSLVTVLLGCKLKCLSPSLTPLTETTGIT